ncbi:ATP-binding protein [Marivirga harenae]|uniref:sensor histidine kinase n=1 Tax=Marivirga harenae TaxID=2010992 RepID=UPI0026E10173|nr:ATP-binding protein [Marivirga harenae]WKV11677.1 ATP-binding protein [Marivirga harenae]|tara:strand:+ start:183425 stop:184813 length:1389 start_codon:yes stop_codon:yes gene_type:complete
MKYWGAYKVRMAQTILGQTDTNQNLKYYRNQLFFYLILYTFTFSPLAIIPGIIASYHTGFINLLILNIAFFFVLLILAFAKPIKIESRKVILIISLLTVSWALIFNLGLEGPGMMYLYSCIIVTCLIHSGTIAYKLILINSLILVLVGLNIEYQWLNLQLTNEQSMTTWFGITVNLIFVSIVIVACFEMIFRKMDIIIHQQRTLNEIVKSDNKKMKDTQNILQGKNEELSQFAHIIAHDLKEPLRTMQAFSDLTISKYKESIPERGQEFLNHIKSSSIRMALLLDSLLEYAQLGKDKKKSTFSVHALMKELEQDLSQLIKENKASINYDQLPEITAYEIEFKQLLQNLIANAVKFKKEDEKITVNIEANENSQFWEFSIQDNGIGIDQKHQEKIFTIFHRLHKNRFAGTGLGLANCKKIVEMHNGKIWIDSVPEEGSTFHFTINKNLLSPEENQEKHISITK